MDTPHSPKIVLIHANEDQKWGAQLQTHLIVRFRGPVPLTVRTWSEERFDKLPTHDGLRAELESAAAMVFLLSDELLASPFVRDEGIATIFAAAAQSIPAFRVLSRPSRLDLGFLSSSSIEMLGPDGQALSTISSSRLDSALVRIADVVISRIEQGLPNEPEPIASSNVGRSSNVGPSSKADVRQTATNVASEDASEEPSASEGMSDSHVPLTRLSELATADSIPILMERAVEMASGVTPPIAVSTSFMFFAFTEPMETQPNWAAPFIRELILGQTKLYEATRDAYFRRKGSRGARPRQRTPRAGAPRMMTRHVFMALERSRDIAERTTGRPEIHARHLLVALLHSDESKERFGVLNRIAEMKIDLAALREALFDWLRGQGDDDAAWEELLLGTLPTVHRLSGFSTDRVGGEDLLGIEPEVRALATLIAARTVAPPLSIGLFGEWGSGKTFFMRQLRTEIDKKSREARDAKQMQRDVPFYKHIVQIEFNAWHYVEGNLWASLVEHILDNLYPNEDPTGTRTLQAKLIKKLADEKALSIASSNAVDSAKAAATKAQQELSAAQTKLDAKTKELAKLNADHVRRDFVLTGAHGPVLIALQQLGLDKAGPLGVAAVDLEGALRQIHGSLERGQRLLAPLTRATDRNRRFNWLLLSLLGAPVMAILVHFVMQKLGSTTSDIYAYATGVATLIASVVPWLKKQAQWISDRVDDAEKAQKAFDEEMAKHTATHVQNVTEAEQKLRELTAAVDSAAQKHAEAQSREAAAAAELEAATAGRLLANFISDRAASTDYRKHLGVLALVRDDFEKLSALIEEVNWTLSPDDPLEKPRSDSMKRFATLAEEEKDKDGRINRIVLYIDDLDRCPPNKVVEVLQAVHLLLAFPLFVVVVGVDARWITRSLQTRYRELLLLTDKSGNGDSDTGLLGTASPNDYLEKIFQIPFWLKQMDPAMCDRMVRGLLKPSMARTQDGSNGAAQGSTATAPAVAGGAPNVGASPATTPSGAAPVAGSQPADSATSAAQPAADPAVTDQQADQLTLESLEIVPAEIDFMTKLAPLLGRSPRAIKRFANVYRLIKVGLVSHEQRTFLRPGIPLGAYQIVLFLLAVDTGAPAVARNFFAIVEEGATTAPSRGSSTVAGPHNMKWLVESLGAKLTNREETLAWLRVKDWLLLHGDVVSGDTELADLATWTRRVGRYSFEIGQS